MSEINFLVLIFLILVAILVFLLIKNEVTFSQRNKVIDACYQYSICENISVENLIEIYNSMEDYDKTLFRLWDWGYKNIISKAEYEKIQKYI